MLTPGKLLLSVAFVIIFLNIPNGISALPASLPPADGNIHLIPANDTRFLYEGRWASSTSKSGESERRADWPCSRIVFDVQTRAAAGTNNNITLVWHNVRNRVNASVWEGGRIVSTQYFVGESVDLDGDKPREDVLVLPSAPAKYTVTLRKVTTAAPFGSGIGGKILRPSVIRFLGTRVPSGGSILLVERNKPRRRRIEFIGGSDTAGYCVDGTPKMGSVQTTLEGWKYENCDSGYVGLTGFEFGGLGGRRGADDDGGDDESIGAEISVQAISGIGLTQNANAKQKWQLGSLSMPGYFNRTLQTDAKDAPVWDFQSFVPDLVVISLGGNDFNHQGGNVPSNKTFSAAYGAFLLRIFQVYEDNNNALNTTIISVCGQGSPVEKKYDPDNNRCRPCPHVDDATVAFQRDHPALASRVHYIFVPCDGSVVTGQGDIGCAGHKNKVGQAKVAKFLRPKLASIMKWP